MRNDFFIDRYASQKHDAYVRQAARDRLARDLRPRTHRVINLDVQAGRLLISGAAAVILTLATGAAYAFAATVERFDEPTVLASGLVAYVEVASVRWTEAADARLAEGVRGVGGAHVVDRWYETPDLDTADLGVPALQSAQ